MNFAFSALLILFLALPGIIAWHSYRLTTGIPIASRPLTDEVPIGLALSAILHCVWIALANLIGIAFGLRVNIGAAVTLLSGQSGKDGELFKHAEHAFSAHFWWVALYFFSICACAGPLGRLFRYLTAGTWIARNLPPYRGNDWFYLLKGESPGSTWANDEGSVPGEELLGIMVAAVVGDQLYKGFLVDYVFGKGGEVDAIVLGGAARRKLGDGEKPNCDPHFPSDRDGNKNHPDYFTINAEHFILKYSEASNLAVTRIWGVAENPAPAPPVVHSLAIAIVALGGAVLVGLAISAVAIRIILG